MELKNPRLSPRRAITVSSSARLHLGFIDPNGSLGRSFGSVGLTIEGHDTRITAKPSQQATRIQGTTTQAQHDRIREHVEQLKAALNESRHVDIEVHETPRPHTGLGSGTQLALAVGTAFARITGHHVDTAEIARILHRGARSGIGIHGFDHGGLIVDGGRNNASTLPPLIARQSFPDAWRILLIDDTSREGLHGDAEKRGLAALAPFPAALAAHLSHLVLMQILPAVAESDFDTFASAITIMQQTIGEYFAPVQGGLFASPAVAHALEAVAAEQKAGIGQTSWGPVGFAFLASAEDAERALVTARQAARNAPLACSITTARNRGATWRAADHRHRGADAA
ncbi:MULTISPECIES: beta-ribofuranosylaminobenzene 5'-phosphate synthase family protein [unclassified Caballeronia]|uniref:beta-ribofuranosylaminobenzene 5'-phosphate synthase family protein n=1 Tax=unclassified Caballeronia TaxID=2646786 RepID=UPI00285EBEE2|nr:MULTISPECIES: beta-ribofuranosylaminobenzene 5'-phosphate synthase family protein [unclassified Caballeronia]MDR5739952.1 beta-ribofuranosylaminobenzene 5'-phosphate synthase [Caballeronia sp. LZ016]MDR5807344.1 beta-ribofuranosylaminobenzene 5'-phosphate synthase [Caballeronia sp. LZ019]